MIHRRLAQNIESSMQAGRTYGGCSGAGAGKQLRDGREEDIFLGGLQDVFGGHLSKNNQEESGEQDEFGPLVFECSEGHRNERKKGELLTECQNKHCKGSVGCGEPMPVTEKVKKQ